MQTTSQTWKTLWAGGNARLETKAVINGTEYTEISNPSINRALMQNGCSIGNAVSATCIFAVRTNASIPKSAEVVIKFRLTDGTTTSEWLNAGTFYISHRSRDPVTGVLKLECYDALLKANARMPKLMPWTTKGGVPITTAGGEIITLNAHYPRRMVDVIHDLAILLGNAIRIDPSTTVETGDDYVITADDVAGNVTINHILCKIAAANGGNWIMTPDNYLKLVPLKSAAGAASAASDVVDVVAVTGNMDTGRTGTITGIRYTADGEEVVAGDDTGIVIDANVSAAVASDLQTKLVGMTYQAYALKSAIYDPATEVGDYVRAGTGGEIRAVLCAETATYGLAYRGDISAPEIGELSDEYPYFNLDNDLVEYVDEAVAYLDNSLTQQEIFDRLTDGGLEQGIALEAPLGDGPSAAGEKKIFINLDYARIGKLLADYIQGGELTLGGLDNINGIFKLLDENGAVALTGNANGIALNGSGKFSSEDADGESRMELTTGGLNFYRKNGSAFQQILRMLVATTGSEIGTRITAITDPLLIEAHSANGIMMRSFASASDLTTYGQYVLHKDTFYVNFVASGSPVGGLGVSVNNGAFTLEVFDGSAFLTGESGSFTTADGKTVTVTNGIITAIT